MLHYVTDNTVAALDSELKDANEACFNGLPLRAVQNRLLWQDSTYFHVPSSVLGATHEHHYCHCCSCLPADNATAAPIQLIYDVQDVTAGGLQAKLI